MMEIRDRKKLVKRLVILAVLTAVTVVLAVFMWKEDTHTCAVYTTVIAFILFCRTVDRAVELLFHVWIFSMVPLMGLLVLYYGLKDQQTAPIIAGSFFVLCEVPLVFVQVRKSSAHARPRYLLGDKEMDRQEIKQREREDALFRAMEKTESGEDK